MCPAGLCWLQELSSRLQAHFAAADKKPWQAAAGAAAGQAASLEQQPASGADASDTPGPFKMSFDDALPLQVGPNVAPPMFLGMHNR